MNTKILIYTIAHLALAILFVFLALGASGYGFKDNWSILNYIYIYTSIIGAAILTFPLWVLSFLNAPTWLTYLAIPTQIVISYSQVKLFIYLKHNYAKT